MRGYKRTKLAGLILALTPLALMAEDVAKSPSSSAGTDDLIWYVIYGLMGVLLISILLLSNVLLNLVRLTIDKHKVKAAALILILVSAGNLFAQTAETPLAKTSSMVTNWNMIMAITVLCTEIFVVFVLLLRIRLMVSELAPKQETKPAFSFRFPKILDNFNASVSVEKEHDILLDHNYDGIRELDNNLPPWWKYSFFISIIWATCYFSYYHLFGGPSSHDEYNEAVRIAKERQDEYARLNAGKVDENTVALADAAGIAEGKTIFATNCAACHGKNGEGIVGPNLTDQYWLHGGDIKDIFKSIKYGWPAKGMKSWQTDLSPVDIRNVASYIKSIGGSNPPNAKAPQGDLYNEEGITPKPGTQAAADTMKVKTI